ncbi:MAG: hypothetical protein R3B84_02030 [Zavarzinella sp.]
MIRRAIKRFLLGGLLATGSVSYGAEGITEGRVTYTSNSTVELPFRINNAEATQVVLYVQIENGPWVEADRARAGRSAFTYRFLKEGTHNFALMTIYSDGVKVPASTADLRAERVYVADRTKPEIRSVRPVVDQDGFPGLEWDIADTNMLNQNAVKLEYRWDGVGTYQELDKGMLFGPRHQRFWKMKPEDRMQVRLIARDKAGNVVESTPQLVSSRAGCRPSTGIAMEQPRNPALNPVGNPGNNMELSPVTSNRASSPSLHFVATKNFTINSTIMSGPSGIVKSELYRADDKLKWQLVSTDAKLQKPPGNKEGPIPISLSNEVEEDGVYSYIVIAHNHKGPSRRAPVDGEQGDFAIMVDTKKPELVDEGVRVSASDRGPIVDIRWKAVDANLAASPIRLEYSIGTDKDVKWTEITSDWIENVGQYSWYPPTDKGYLFNIRMRCRDRANNETEYVVKDPVNIDLTVPEVNITGVNPRQEMPGSFPSGPGGISIVPGKPK